MNGVIKKLNEKGFGFIAVEGEQDVFFHASSLPNAYEDFENLQEGMSVTFDIAEGNNGKTSAANIVVGGAVDAE